MKKTFCAVLALIILVAGTLTGCVSNEPFDDQFIVSAASLYGVRPLTSANAYSLVGSVSGKYGQSGYYVSQSKEDAQYIYNNYINENNWNPPATINQIALVTVKEQVVSAVYDADCCVLYFDDSAAAKSYFDAAKDTISDETYKSGYSGGYAYAIAYKLTANRDGNCDWVKGFYLKGNSVLVIYGFSPIGIADTFLDYIYDELEVVDPITLKK